MAWRRMLLFTQWFQSPFKKIIFPALTFSVIFPALTFLVHRYFSLLSMWLIVTLEWLCFSAPEIITLIRNGQSLNWLRLRTWHPCIHSVLGCYVWLSSVEARWCHLCWFPPGIQRQEVVWVPSLWWPWCPRVQIASSQGNSKPRKQMWVCLAPQTSQNTQCYPQLRASMTRADWELLSSLSQMLAGIRFNAVEFKTWETQNCLWNPSTISQLEMCL